MFKLKWKKLPDQEKQEKPQETDPGISKTGASLSGIKGTVKSAIGFIPFAGSAINTLLEEAKNAKDNEDAKQQLVEEIKYSILLIESSRNLINYIQLHELTTRLCDSKITADMNELIMKITNMLKELRRDDAINIKSNSEIEKLIISDYLRKLPPDLDPSQRASLISAKREEIYSEFCERNRLNDEDVEDQIKRINSTEEIIKIGKFLLNTRELLGNDRLFIINEKTGKKEYLSLETFLNDLGLSTFLDETRKKSLDDGNKSNVVKYLQNVENIEAWINSDKDIFDDFKKYPFIGTHKHESLIVFTLNAFLMTFLNNGVIPETKYTAFIKAQDFLLNLNSNSLQVLMLVLNDVSEVESQVAHWVAILECKQKGVPKAAETRFSARNLFAKISVTSDFVNLRINLNIVATQLNSLYQALLFQVLQIKTMDPAQREELLCPTFSMDMFR